MKRAKAAGTSIPAGAVKSKRRRNTPGESQPPGDERKLTRSEIRELRARLFSRPSGVRARNKKQLRAGELMPSPPFPPPLSGAQQERAGDLVAIAQRAIAELDGCLRKQGLLVFQDGSAQALAGKIRPADHDHHQQHTEGVQCVVGATRIQCVGRSRLSAFDKDANLLACIKSISVYPVALASAEELRNTVMHELVHIVAHYVTKHRRGCLTPDSARYVADLDSRSEEGLCRLAGRLFAEGRGLDSGAACLELWQRLGRTTSSAAAELRRIPGYGQAVECARKYGLGFAQLFLAVTEKGSINSVLTYGPGAPLQG